MKDKSKTKLLTITAVLMAINVAVSSFGVPVPGGHLYLTDVVICFSALLLSPFWAFCVGGIGALIGDFFFYPVAMFVSLVVHGIQAGIISFISHRFYKKDKKLGYFIALLSGAVIMVFGYTLGCAFIYGTVEVAIINIPYEALQATVGAVLGYILYTKFKNIL